MFKQFLLLYIVMFALFSSSVSGNPPLHSQVSDMQARLTGVERLFGNASALLTDFVDDLTKDPDDVKPGDVNSSEGRKSLPDGSTIMFNASTANVKQGLTSSLTLQCQLTAEGMRDATHSAEVMSLLVMKDGNDVASVSRLQPAQVMDASGNVEVEGSVNASGTQRGFIQVQIKNPDSAQLVRFVCEINVINNAGHVTTLSRSLKVGETTPTLADLIGYIRHVNREKEQMKNSIENIKQESHAMRTELAGLRRQVEMKVLFSAALTKAVTLATGQVLVFDKILMDVGGAYNNITGSFVCPEPGYYQFTLSALSVHNKHFSLTLYHNSRDVIRFHGPAGQGHQGNSQTSILKLVSGDVVQVRAYSGAFVYGSPTDPHTTFTGIRVSAL